MKRELKFVSKRFYRVKKSFAGHTDNLYLKVMVPAKNTWFSLTRYYNNSYNQGYMILNNIKNINLVNHH